MVFPACSAPEPGYTVHASGNRVVFGEPAASAAPSPRVQRVTEAFKAAGFGAEASSDVRREIWLKLLGNMCFNPVSALMGCSTDQMIDDARLYQLFTGMMQTHVHIVAKELKPISAGVGLAVLPDTTLAECPDDLDVVFVPGGLDGTAKAMQDPEILAFLQRQAKTARYITSVCTGSLVLGAAGLLKGKKAATYWAARDILPLLGATPVVARYVEDGNIITAGGVTAGLDFGLKIVAKLASDNYAKALQLYYEYDPAPPFKSGSPETAEPQVVAAMRGMYADGVETLRSAALRNTKKSS